MRYFLTPWFISSLRSPPPWRGWKRNRLSFLLAIKTQRALNISLGVGTMLIIGAAVISCSYLVRGHRWLVIMSPLWRGGDILVYLCPLSSSAQFEFLCSLCLSCRRSNTRRWPNGGLMSAHRLWRWANDSPVLGSVSCLAPRWMWASVTDGGPTLTHLWFKASYRRTASMK